MSYRVLLIVPDFYPNQSGYARACTGFAQAIARAGMSVRVLTFVELAQAAELREDNIEISRLRRGGWNMLLDEYPLIKALRAIGDQETYDFIFFETAEFPLAALYALRAFGDRVIVRIHGCAETEWALYRKTRYYRQKKHLTRWLLRSVRNIFSTTSYYIEFIKRTYLEQNPLLTAEKYFDVIPNVLPDGEVSESAGTDVAVPAHGQLMFVTLGRMDYHGELQKNFSRVLGAMSLLKDRSYFRDLMLVVIGYGERQPHLVEYAKELGIKDRVSFLDAMDNQEVQLLQRKCHGVIAASTFEGLSMFALEALANGAPLLASGTSGLKELVEDGVNGVLFDPMNVYDIASKIDFFVTRMLPDIRSVRAAARRKYETGFSRDKVVQRLQGSLAVIAARNRAAKTGAAR